ncbi:rhomboid-domain-containing protein [Westerdykella ornata]|uniref:Rhomboid-type serine protease n=1 Tax=Westerdykella ornata TaxID=318751 RepID=A0A6A6JQ79_WESOR|nr:rhomboid-domain-containing protein [Westerdykella ornata]KAF2278800.1 rhomboid-domain-containing protein [Westerdykella ornata]
MAANDYYSSFGASNSHSDNRTDAPLPPAPGAQSTHSISPVTSPFDDTNQYDYLSTSHQNLAQHPAPMGYDDTAYHGSTNQYPQKPYFSNPHHSDPFTDHNAIPLHSQGKMGSGSTGYQMDPEGSSYQTGPTRYSRSRKKGWFSGRITWVVYILTVVQIGVFIGELAKNAALTSSPIQTKPRFNIMIGPGPGTLIVMGARYAPCMHNIRNVTDFPEVFRWPCPNSTTDDLNSPSRQCTLQQHCGMGSGVPEQIHPTPFRDRSREPNQWWRFITPIFLHAGIIHIGFNMLLQLTLGRDMEKEIGAIRFALVYFSAGIFGNVLGGNYAGPALPSTGASGALFGVLALVLLDLLYNWNSRPSPVKDLLFLLLDFAIAFVLGLLPGLDNFAHIGGFLMGLVLGICLLHSPAALRERIGVDEPPYSTVENPTMSGALGGKPALNAFVKKPVGFFKGRKPLWWAWWLVRAGSLVAVFIGFILLLKNFYEWRNECSWCMYLSCLPVYDWCKMGDFDIRIAENNPTQGQDQSQNPAALMARALLAGGGVL